MDLSNPAVIAPLTGLAGLVIGFVLARLLADDGASSKAVEELRTEFDEYKEGVSEHFDKTSELFRDMTETYRDVYNHMAGGAQLFGAASSAAPRLEIVDDAAQVEDAGDASDEGSETIEGTAEETSSQDTAATDDAPDQNVDNDTTDPVSTDDAVPTEATADDTVTDSPASESAANEEDLPNDPPKDYAESGADGADADARLEEKVTVEGSDETAPDEQRKVSA